MTLAVIVIPRSGSRWGVPMGWLHTRPSRAAVKALAQFFDGSIKRMEALGRIFRPSRISLKR